MALQTNVFSKTGAFFCFLNLAVCPGEGKKLIKLCGQSSDWPSSWRKFLVRNPPNERVDKKLTKMGSIAGSRFGLI